MLMEVAPWYVACGLIIVLVSLVATPLKRLPLSISIVCLVAGILLGPGGFRLIDVSPTRHDTLLEHLSEVGVIVSLFTAGLKLRVPLRDPQWAIPLRLAFASMTVTVALIALIGVAFLALPLGAAILLGAVLAPTDPVLASEVQLEHSADRDRLRYALTAEAGLNDGTAFPFVMLGLALLGLHDIGPGGWRWWAIDLAWAVLGGLAIGIALGTCVGKLVLYLRLHHQEAVGVDNLLAVGLIALAYGLALLAHTYGFLAVFAAAVALRLIEMSSSSAPPSREVRQLAGASEHVELATAPDTARAYMAEAILNFNNQLERFAEIGLVTLVGALLRWDHLQSELIWFAPLMLLVVRPVAVMAGLAGTHTSRLELALIGWFGIRGIGSVYYLMFAIARAIPAPLDQRLVSLVLMMIAISVVVHGITATPLINVYRRRQQR